MTFDSLLPRVKRIESEYRKILFQALIVDEARKAAGYDGDDELTYGTTPARLMIRILLDVLRAGPLDTFYDLGCGLGVPTMVASLICKKATGIDLLPPVLTHARRVAKALNLPNARFISGDFRDKDLSDGTAFYSYSTCFSRKTRAAMAEKVATCRPGALIATVTYKLDHPELDFIERVPLRWGLMSHAVFLHMRR